MSGKVIRMSGRTPAYAPHELEKLRDEFERGVVVDHLDGVVGEAEIERAEQQSRDPLEPNWSLSQ